MIWTGPTSSVDPLTGLALDDPLSALTEGDRTWLERMADVLPDHMVVRGTERWLLTRFDPWMTSETIRG